MRTGYQALVIVLFSSLFPYAAAGENQHQFKTADFLDAQWSKVAYDATFQKVNDRLYSIRLVFPGQLGINTGYGSMEASFVSYCLSSIVTAREGYEGWSQGFENSSNAKTIGVSELNLFLLLLRKGESAQSVGPSHISWPRSVFNDDPAVRDACRKLLKPQALWWRE
jgi:hypothetical protein